jgi:hypothetical protein
MTKVILGREELEAQARQAFAKSLDPEVATPEYYIGMAAALAWVLGAVDEASWDALFEGVG